MLIPNIGRSVADLSRSGRWNSPPPRRRLVAKKASIVGIFFSARGLFPDRPFVPVRGFALAGPLLLLISVPLLVATHHRAAPPQPRGGRPALAGERTRSPGLEPTKVSASIDSTDALFAENVEQKIEQSSSPHDHSWIA